MGERKISGWQAWKDIACGMPDDALMKKYKLSRNDLDKLYETLVRAGLLERIGEGYAPVPKKRIEATKLVEDIRSGMSNDLIMEKYGLSPPLLAATFRRLLDDNLIHREDLESRSVAALSQVSLFSVREVQRFSSPFTVVVSDPRKKNGKGRVLDISVKGIRTVGIETSVGKTETLTIHGDEYGEITPFQVTVTCRWTRRDSKGRLLAGFEMTEIPSGSKQELLHWIRMCKQDRAPAV